MYISTANEVITLERELRGYYRDRDSNSQEWRKLALGTVETKAPGSDTDRVTLPTSYAIVQLATGLLGAQRPRIRVPRKKDTKGAQLQAERLEKFLIGAWYRNQRERRNFALRKAIWYAVVDGWFCFKTLFDQAKWENDEFPLVIRALDPTSILPQPNSERPEYVIESYKRPLAEVRDRFGHLFDGGGDEIQPGRRDTDMVRWTEYWDEEQIFYLLDGMPFYEQENGYKTIPYTVGFGYQTPILSGGSMGLGMLAPIADVLKQEQRNFIAEVAIVEKFAWPTVLVESPQGDKFELDLRPGSINYLLPGESVSYLEWKSTLPEYKQLTDEIKSHIDRATFSGLQYGEKQPSGTSGYLGSILASSTQIKLNPVKESLEFAMEEVNELMLRYVERHVDDVISVDGIDHRNKDFETSIKPEDIAGYYRNNVELRAILPEDEVQKAMTGVRLVQANIISRMTAREKYAMVESPEEEEQMILKEKIAEHPLVLAGAGLKAARSWGVDVKELAASMEQEKQANAGQMPVPAGEGPPGGLPKPQQAPLAARQIQPAGPQRPGPMPGTPPPRRPPRPLPAPAPARTAVPDPMRGFTSGLRPPNPVPREMRRAGALMPLAPPPPPPAPGVPPRRVRVPGPPRNAFDLSAGGPIAPMPRRR